jgi:hypothetical protein
LLSEKPDRFGEEPRLPAALVDAIIVQYYMVLMSRFLRRLGEQVLHERQEVGMNRFRKLIPRYKKPTSPASHCSISPPP